MQPGVPPGRLWGVNRASLWQAAVIAVGLGLSAVAGLVAAPVFGERAGAVWAGWLVYVFALAYGANRLQRYLARPPMASSWKAAALGATAFIPMFLGWFPASSWAMETSAATRYHSIPSPVWILIVMLWGLVAPGGAVLDGTRRLVARSGRFDG